MLSFRPLGVAALVIATAMAGGCASGGASRGAARAQSVTRPVVVLKAKNLPTQAKGLSTKAKSVATKAKGVAKTANGISKANGLPSLTDAKDSILSALKIGQPNRAQQIIAGKPLR